ncbi:MAG: SDR family NAD(P)-dependent oxidoreductase, partial [Phycisphaerales bacterium]|nr:SDR family NAD(P)-dependent oxidoreductase [Phycisphaerales bacterium]
MVELPTHRLDGHVALVTGSSKGLGRYMALGLADAGAKVVINCYNDAAKGESVLAEVRERGGDGAFVKGSAIDEGDVNRMVREASDALGPIDIVVLNATPDQPQMP